MSKWKVVDQGIRPCPRCGVKDAPCVVELVPGGFRRRCLGCGSTKRVYGYPRRPLQT